MANPPPPSTASLPARPVFMRISERWRVVEGCRLIPFTATRVESLRNTLHHPPPGAVSVDMTDGRRLRNPAADRHPQKL